MQDFGLDLRRSGDKETGNPFFILLARLDASDGGFTLQLLALLQSAGANHRDQDSRSLGSVSTGLTGWLQVCTWNQQLSLQLLLLYQQPEGRKTKIKG